MHNEMDPVSSVKCCNFPLLIPVSVIIIAYIYKAPLLSRAYSVLQLDTTFTIHTAEVLLQSHLVKCNLLTKHTHTHTHTHTQSINQSINQYYDFMLEKDGLECWLKGRNWLRKSDFFWKCVPECWSSIREKAFTVWLSVDRWNAQHADVCWRSEMPRGCVNLE